MPGLGSISTATEKRVPTVMAGLLAYAVNFRCAVDPSMASMGDSPSPSRSITFAAVFRSR